MTSRTITADATGRREARPDLATVDVTTIGEGESAAGARAMVRDRTAAVRESLSDVPVDRIRTGESRVQDTSETFDPVTDAQYQAKERLHVDCGPEAAETVVEAVIDAGGTVRSVEFGLHGSVYRRLQNEALAAAMERAREKADRIAAVEGLPVGEVRDVTTEDASTGMERIVDEALGSNPEVDVNPAPVSVSEAVEVVYELTEE